MLHLAMNELKIDVSEKFEHLPRAPIIEAIIDIRARGTLPWDVTRVMETLKPQLVGYPLVAIQNKVLFGVIMTGGPMGGVPQQEASKDLQFKSEDQRQIATFSRDGFSFSRLKPYEKWENLRDEALRLWQIHVGLAKPSEIQRLGLRFLNRIDLPSGEIGAEDYIDPYPSGPRGLSAPFTTFLHFDSFGTPGYPFVVNIIRNLQPSQPPLAQAAALILDISVFTLQAVEFCDNKWLEDRLAEMRWLKNKAFFGSVTAKAIKSFE